MGIRARLVAKQIEYVEDSNGNAFSPASGDHSYTWDASGNMLTDTVVGLDGITRVKTMTYNALNQMLTESKWVVQ